MRFVCSLPTLVSLYINLMTNSVKSNYYYSSVATPHRQTDISKNCQTRDGCASGPVTTTGMLTLPFRVLKGLKGEEGKRILQQGQYSTQYINDKKEI